MHNSWCLYCCSAPGRGWKGQSLVKAISQTCLSVCILLLKFPSFEYSNQGSSAKWFSFALVRKMEYVKHFLATPCGGRSETSTLQLRPKTTSPLVFHPLCLTRLTFCLGAVGKHCQSSKHETCGVITHHRKMRPLTGSGGKKKHKALCSSPPSSEECTHCKPVSSWGTPHPGTFIFNPWPLAHLET